MEGHGFVIAAGPGLHTESVDDEVRELPGAAAQRLDFRKISFLFEFQHRAMKQHRRAGSARDDHGLVAGKGADGMPDDFAGGRPIAAIERRLPATGLRFGENHLAPEVFQHLHGGRRDIVVEGVAQAGGHELHAFASERRALRVEHERSSRPWEAPEPLQLRFARQGSAGPPVAIFLFPLSRSLYLVRGALLTKEKDKENEKEESGGNGPEPTFFSDAAHPEAIIPRARNRALALNRSGSSRAGARITSTNPHDPVPRSDPAPPGACLLSPSLLLSFPPPLLPPPCPALSTPPPSTSVPPAAASSWALGRKTG